MRLGQNFKMEDLTFIAFFATLPLYSPNLPLFRGALGSGTLMPWFVDAMMLTAIVAGLGIALWTARRSDAIFSTPPLVMGSALLYGIGFAVFVCVLSFDTGMGEALAVTAGVMVALGCVPLCVAWGATLSAYGIRQALFWLAIMCGIAAIIELALSSVAFEVGVVVYFLLLIIGCGLPCHRAATHVLADSFKSNKSRECEGGQDPLRTTLIGTVRSMASVTAMPFIGLMVFAFVMGLRKFFVFDLFHAEALGGMAASVIVLPLCFLRSEKPFMPFLYQVFLPACALILVVLNSFPYGTVAQWLGATLSYAFFGIIGVLALASLCGMAHAREFSPASIYGLTVACFMSCSFLGIRLGAIPVVFDHAGPVLLVLCTLYFAFLTFTPLLQTWLRSAQPEASAARVAQRGDDPLQAALHKRCAALAERFGLSPRETEILVYQGRGHGVAYIAKTLVISESTVRTHVKGIYRKLQVSSREELLQLIDRDDA